MRFDPSAATFHRKTISRASLLLFGVAALMLWAASEPGRWSQLGVTMGDHVFLDAHAVLASAQAKAMGMDPFQTPNPLDPAGRPHVYGPAWLWLGDLGFTVHDTVWFGIIIGSVFVVTVARMFAPGSWTEWGLLIAAAVSPPVLLGLNRANNDLLLFVLTAGTAWFASRRGLGAEFAVCIGAIVGVLLKFYPLAMLPALAAFPGDWPAVRRRILWVCLTICVAVLLDFESYRRAWLAAPNIQTVHGYGLKFFAYLVHVTFTSMPPLQTWWGMVFGGLASCGILWVARREWARFLATTGAWAYLTVASACAWIGCLIAGSNFCYRAVWLLPLLAWGWRARRAFPRAAPALVGLVLVFLWARLPTVLFSDLLNVDSERWAPVFANAFGFEQTLSVATWVACVWMVMGWAWRRHVEWRSCAQVLR